MSVKIENNAITITRGDTLITKVSIKNADGTQYIPEADDVIRFGMKKTIKDEKCLFEKVIPVDTMELRLEAFETKTLATGDYLYDIQIEFASGDIYTFITQAKLKVTGEIV